MSITVDADADSLVEKVVLMKEEISSSSVMIIRITICGGIGTVQHVLKHSLNSLDSEIVQGEKTGISTEPTCRLRSRWRRPDVRTAHSPVQCLLHMWWTYPMQAHQLHQWCQAAH